MASFGIDFGTTNTSVVDCEITKNSVIKSHYGENNQPFPSLVALHPDLPPCFGSDVKKQRSQLIVKGYQVISSFKTILGSDQVISVGSKQYRPTDIAALFLSYVKNRVEAMAGRPLNEAVVAIPVDFRPEQRRDLRQAAETAGIRVKSFVSEPTAAYVYCREDLAGKSNVAVFDWGGGTLDVSMISVENHTVEELAVKGIRLGGDDIDRMIARHLHARIAQKVGDGRAVEDLSPYERDELLDKSEGAKKYLSTDDPAPIRLMRYAGKPMVRDILAFDEFSRLISVRVEEAVSLLFDAAKKADVSLGQMDAILMVGGSCEMQPVYDRLDRISQEYGLTLCRPEGVQWAVAGGAAVLGEQRPAYKLQKGFGVLLSDDSFYPIFETGQTVPCKAPELRFGVVEDTTTAVFVFADEGKNVLARHSVPIKGFTPEGIHLQCEIDGDMIVRLNMFSDYAQRMAVQAELNQLGFSYHLQ